MSQRKLVLVFAFAATALVPASAHAAPTLTVTNDAGQPAPLSADGPGGIRNMDPTVAISIPAAERANYKVQVLGPDNAAATVVSGCLGPGDSASNSADYRGNGAYSVVLRVFGETDTTCVQTSTERRFAYTVTGATGVTPPPTRVLTRQPNSFVTNTHQLGVTLNPGASSYELRYALNGTVGPDGAISGASTPTFLDTTSGLAPFRFQKPGRYVIVARASRAGFFTPWSGAVTVNAIAPFDLERVSFPDSRGPRYKLRGQVRERVARGRVTISWAKGRKGGRFHRIGRAKINKKGRFTKRFTLRRFGVYRLRYTYRGSSLVAAGRVTEQVRIRKRFFFN